MPSLPKLSHAQFVVLASLYGLSRRGTGGGVGGEEITVHEISQPDLRHWLREREREGIQIDVKVWAGLYFLGQ